MNLKGFKKVSEDEHKAVMKNKHGHTITIAKKSLSKSYLDELGKLPIHAAGGTDTPLPFVPGKDYSNAPLPGDQSSEPLEDGPSPEPAPTPVASQSQANESPDDEGSDDVQPLTQEQRNEIIEKNRNRRLRAIDGQPDDSATAQANASAETTPPGAPSLMVNTQLPVADIEANKRFYMDKIINGASGFQKDLYSGTIAPKTYQDLFANKSLPGKIGSIFGLLLSGMGSGLTHQPNMAMQMMDKEIQNDVEAQKQTKTNEFNWHQLAYQHELQEAQQRGMDVDTAMKEAKLRSAASGYLYPLMAVGHGLQTRVDQLPEGQQKQLFQNGVNQWNQYAGNRVIQSANDVANQSASDPDLAFYAQRDRLAQQSQNAAMAGDPLAAQTFLQQKKDLEARHLTGYNQPANRQIAPGDLKDLETLNTLDQSYNDAAKYIKDSGAIGPINPHPSVGMKGGSVLYQKGKRLQARILSEMGQLSGSNRFTVGLKDLHQERMPDLVGTHITNEDMQAVQDLQREVRQRRASILSSYGLGKGTQPQMSESDRQAAEAWLKQNPTAPDADKVKRILGQ